MNCYTTSIRNERIAAALVASRASRLVRAGKGRAISSDPKALPPKAASRQFFGELQWQLNVFREYYTPSARPADRAHHLQRTHQSQAGSAVRTHRPSRASGQDR